MKAGSSIKMIDPKDYNTTDLNIYPKLVEKLIYLLYGIRSDIIFVVKQLSRYNVNRRKKHLQTVKQVVRYLKRNIIMRLIFGQASIKQLPRDSPPYGLVSYADSNFAKDLEDLQLVMSYCFFINKAVISWNSKKQRTVSTSMTEVEYIVLRYIAKAAIRIKKFINNIELEAVVDLILYENNEMSTALIKNTESQYCTKHINV